MIFNFINLLINNIHGIINLQIIIFKWVNNMKNYKKYLICIIVIVLFCYLCSFIYSNRKIKINNSNDIWELYDLSLNNIKNNMDEITTSNNISSNNNLYWLELKDFDIDDETYKLSLNTMLSSIRNCYWIHTRGNGYTTNRILDYRNKTTIKKKDLDLLRTQMNNDFTCLRNFDYNGIVLSDKEENGNNLLNELNNIVKFANSKSLNINSITYDELLMRNYIEVLMLDDLTSWLKNEYYKLK